MGTVEVYRVDYKLHFL